MVQTPRNKKREGDLCETEGLGKVPNQKTLIFGALLGGEAGLGTKKAGSGQGKPGSLLGEPLNVRKEDQNPRQDPRESPGGDTSITFNRGG